MPKEPWDDKRLESVSIILPVINETTSLRSTIDAIERSSARDVAEYLIVVCEKTSPESLAVAREYERRDPKRFCVLLQKKRFLGGAMQDAFDATRASHVLMMASDLETDPATVPDLIERAKGQPTAIVTASRWIGGATFRGYHPLKLVANFIFQKSFSLLYGTRLTDMTFGFRIFPASLVKSIAWQELKHSMLFETLLKPLRLGVTVYEVPSSWRAREEGISSNTLGATFRYAWTGVRIRFAKKSGFIRPPMKAPTAQGVAA